MTDIAHENAAGNSNERKPGKHCNKEVVNGVYGVLDGAVNTYSTIKSFFDFSHCTESQAITMDLMHQWIETDEGLCITLASSAMAMAWAGHANYNEKNFSNKSWRYAREFLQASRNSLKANRTVLLTLSAITAENFKYLILPATLGFGGLYVLNRIFMLTINDKRKAIHAEQDRILAGYIEQLNKGVPIVSNETPEFFKLPSDQSYLYYAIRAYNGLVDGAYLYLGIVLGIATLTPPLLFWATLLSISYASICVLTRIYEEYEAQQKLKYSEEYRKLLEAISDIMKKFKENPVEESKLDSIKQLDEQCQNVEAHTQPIATQLIFLGFKHALPYYGAIVSGLFALSFVIGLCNLTLSPFFVFCAICTGLPLLIIGITHAFVVNAYEVAERNKLLKENINPILKNQNSEITDEALTSYLEARIKLALKNSSLTHATYAENAEVYRSFGAGLLKGRKEIELLFNRYQELDPNDHYQDSFIMNVLIAPTALLYALVFSLKAWIKGSSPSKPTLQVEGLFKKDSTSTLLTTPSIEKVDPYRTPRPFVPLSPPTSPPSLSQELTPSS